MNASRLIQFAVATTLISAGCAVLLFNGLFALSTISFGLPWLVLMRRADFSRPVQRPRVDRHSGGFIHPSCRNDSSEGVRPRFGWRAGNSSSGVCCATSDFNDDRTILAVAKRAALN